MARLILALLALTLLAEPANAERVFLRPAIEVELPDVTVWQTVAAGPWYSVEICYVVVPDNVCSLNAAANIYPLSRRYGERWRFIARSSASDLTNGPWTATSEEYRLLPPMLDPNGDGLIRIGDLSTLAARQVSPEVIEWWNEIFAAGLRRVLPTGEVVP